MQYVDVKIPPSKDWVGAVIRRVDWNPLRKTVRSGQVQVQYKGKDADKKHWVHLDNVNEVRRMPSYRRPPKFAPKTMVAEYLVEHTERLTEASHRRQAARRPNSWMS